MQGQFCPVLSILSQRHIHRHPLNIHRYNSIAEQANGMCMVVQVAGMVLQRIAINILQHRPGEGFTVLCKALRKKMPCHFPGGIYAEELLKIIFCGAAFH